MLICIHILKAFYLHSVVRIISVYISYLETEPRSDKIIPSKFSSQSDLEMCLFHYTLLVCIYLLPIYECVTIRIYYLYFHKAYLSPHTIAGILQGQNCSHFFCRYCDPL